MRAHGPGKSDCVRVKLGVNDIKVSSRGSIDHRCLEISSFGGCL